MILAIEETQRRSVQHFKTEPYPCNITSAKKSTLALPYWSKFWWKVTFILKLQSLIL